MGHGRESGLKAKCWDLSDAYKQLPLSDHAFDHDAYLVVYDPDAKQPLIFQQRVLPFGSVASVTSFLRLSNALWKVGTELLHLMWSSYFDDFLSLTEIGLEKHTNLVITFLFSTLGWKLSLDKLVDYDCVCKVLGVKLDLSEVRFGSAYVSNTDDRTSELVDELEQIIAVGTLRRKDAERLRGRMQFASGQIFGRSLRNKMKCLSRHIQQGRLNLTEETIEALRFMKEKLQLNSPRHVSGCLSSFVHVYVDASFEPAGYSGVGGIVFDESGKCLGFFSEPVEQPLLERIMQPGQKTVIQELEALAAYVAVVKFQHLLGKRRVVLFSDSEAVRGAFLKSWSSNSNCDNILNGLFKHEEEHDLQIWLERVASQSNPADQLSREVTLRHLNLERIRVDLNQVWTEVVLSSGETSRPPQVEIELNPME